MIAEESFKPPRKKLNIVWWLGGFILLLLGVFFFQLFGPNPPIIVSPKTTRITAPLGPDGLPDYEQYVLELYRDGVTPQNNAATLLWPALWPGELSPPQYAAVAKELGLAKTPSKQDALEPHYSKAMKSRMEAWVASNDDEQAEIQLSAEQRSDQLLDQVISQPWTSEQIPPLAKWIAGNKKPLDMLIEGSRRSRCYFPSPTLLDGERDTAMAMMLPGIQGVREAARALSTRAMWHLGEGRFQEAWQDLLAVQRIGRLTAQGWTIVEQLVGIAIAGMADEATVTILHHGNPTADEVRQVQRDLAGLADFSAMADSIDRLERMAFLDAVVHFDQMNHEDFSAFQFGDQAGIIGHVSVDWNIVLRKGNEYYDRLAAAGRLPTRAQRQRAFGRIDTDLGQLEKDLHSPAAIAAAVINPSRRSDTVAAVMLGFFLPAVDAAFQAQDRANTQLQLTRLAAALAVYRAENGAYPEKLDALVPGVLAELPVDIFNSKPFLYQRDDDGYLLYTAGDNGTDDGGSHASFTIYSGQQLDELDDAEAEALNSKIPAGADDFSIRVPRPTLESPALAVPADEP